MTIDPFMLTSLRSPSTGLPMNIWIPERGRWIMVQTSHHKAFELRNVAKVSLDGQTVVSGYLNAQDLEAVTRYLALNREAILDHWKAYWQSGGIDSAEMCVRLRKA